jgi:hypothetical protein
MLDVRMDATKAEIKEELTVVPMVFEMVSMTAVEWG